jgi:hypothetical protein
MTRDQLVERNCRNYELRRLAARKGHADAIVVRMTGSSHSASGLSSGTLTRHPDRRAR